MKKLTAIITLALIASCINACSKNETAPAIKMPTGENFINDSSDFVKAAETGEAAKTVGIAETGETPKEPIADTNTGESIAADAESLIGTPFKWCGAAPETGFDSSGFIYYVLNKNGVKCQRMLGDQTLIGNKTDDYANLKAGDLVFFNEDKDGDKAQFGGIYIGGGKMIYSPYEDKTVCEIDITQKWWKEMFVFGVAL